MPVPSGKDYLVNVWPTDLNINDPKRDKNYQAYKEQVKKDIEKVRSQVDVIIVAMHWGVEYTHNPTEYQIDSAKFLAENDVDIVKRDNDNLFRLKNKYLLQSKSLMVTAILELIIIFILLAMFTI